LGDSMYVERFYTFFTMCINGLLIKVLWDEITKENLKLRPYAWLAILLWITIPVCFWSYSNNMHENTMSVFILCSVVFSYKAMQSKTDNYFNYVLAGFFISLAVLSKGFPGFFPITLPFLHWLIIRRKSFFKTFIYSSIILLILIIIGIALYLYPSSNESLSIYLFKRAFQRINEVPSVDSRFFIFWRLLSELIPIFIFTAVFFGIARWKKMLNQLNSQYQQAFLFIALGICGSLPLMLTKVQNGFYFVPSLPYFGIGFALLTAPIIHLLFQKIQIKYHQNLVTISSMILIGTLIFTYFQKDKYSRDKDLLNDIHNIAQIVPTQSRINCSNSVYQNWSLNCYLVRMHDISINNIEMKRHDSPYFINEINGTNPDAQLYEEVKLNNKQYTLYKKR